MEAEGGPAVDPLAYKPWHVSLKLRTTHINKCKCIFVVWRLQGKRISASFPRSRETEILKEKRP